MNSKFQVHLPEPILNNSDHFNHNKVPQMKHNYSQSKKNKKMKDLCVLKIGRITGNRINRTFSVISRSAN